MSPTDRAAIDESFATYSGHGGYTPDEALELFEQARRSGCPVAHSDQLGGFHLLFDYEDAKGVHADPETWSSSDGMFRPVVPRMKIPPTEYDNPEHNQWRKDVFDDAINARTPKRIEEDFRKDANDLIDRFPDGGQFDLVEVYNDPLPLWGICRVLGFDIQKGPELRRLTMELMINLGDPEGAGVAIKNLGDFGAQEVAERREHPRDDFLTDLTQASLNGEPLTQEEIAQVVASLVSGGHETTVSAQTNLVWEVLSRPQIKEQLLADPSLIPRAVEESLRLHPPFMGFYRRATKDTAIKGTPISKGEHVMMCWAASNRDPKVFEDPYDFRLDRPNAKAHLSLGYGLHFCIGAPTARMELKVALEELLRRAPGIELAEPDAVESQFGGAENVFIPRLDVKV
jgi:cytochrome P450